MSELPDWLDSAEGPEIEQRLYRARRAGKGRVRRLLRRLRRWRSPRLSGFLVLSAAAILLWAAMPVIRAPSSWSPEDAARHQAARRHCAAARAVGLAPARRGEPGYWAHLDADGDGISCEPWTPR